MWNRISKQLLLPQGRIFTTSYRNSRDLLLEVLRMRRGDKEPIVFVDKTISYKDKLEFIKK